MKEFRVTKDRPPYLSDDILENIKQRDRVMKLARKSKNPDTWKEGLLLVKEVITSCKSAKQAFVKEKLYTNRRDSKKFWDSVKLILPDNQSNLIERLWDEDKQEMVQGLEAAELINNFFVNIAENLASKVGDSDLLLMPVCNELCFEWGDVISAPEVINLLNECDQGKSSGIPELNSKLLVA